MREKLDQQKGIGPGVFDLAVEQPQLFRKLQKKKNALETRQSNTIKYGVNQIIPERD